MSYWKKIGFYAMWLVLLFSIPFTIIINSDINILLKNSANISNFIQRLLGLTAYTLLFWQIILGKYMPKLTERLGSFIFKFHIWEGVAAYLIIVLHPVFFVLYNYFVGRGLDPFYVFTQICVVCSSPTELYYTIGRICFWLINITVLAGLFRTATPFMRVHWMKFHKLNFYIFLLVGLHGFLVGTDFTLQPFFSIAIVEYLIILYIVITKQVPKLYRFATSYLKN